MVKIFVMKRNLIIAIFFLITCMFLSCKRDNNIFVKNDSTQSFAVNAFQVKVIAENFTAPTCENNGLSLKGRYKSVSINKIKDIKIVLTSAFDTALYIVNYENNGFVIISGDKRLQPVLAFSSANSFPSDFSKCPAACIEWMMKVKDVVEKVKKNDKKPDPVLDATWQNMTLQQTQPIDPPPPCTDESLIYGPLISTNWGQGAGFNDSLPAQYNYGCSGMPNGKMLAGCTAVAMAQVMKYHNFPTTYAWSVMPNNYSPFDQGMGEIARLIKNINIAMPATYACTYTSCVENDVSSKLKNNFSFTSATYASYNLNSIINNIVANRPVILNGGSEEERHAWVCDGYEYFKYCVYINGVLMGTNEFQYLDMNWGWNGACNGWYNVYSFNPTINGTTYDFNISKTMTHNILP